MDSLQVKQQVPLVEEERRTRSKRKHEQVTQYSPPTPVKRDNTAFIHAECRHDKESSLFVAVVSIFFGDLDPRNIVLMIGTDGCASRSAAIFRAGVAATLYVLQRLSPTKDCVLKYTSQYVVLALERGCLSPTDSIDLTAASDLAECHRLTAERHGKGAVTSFEHSTLFDGDPGYTQARHQAQTYLTRI